MLKLQKPWWTVLKRWPKPNAFHDNEGDDVCALDYTGSNVDDTFDLGEDAGKVLLARDILSDIGIEWSDNWYEQYVYRLSRSKNCSQAVR